MARVKIEDVLDHLDNELRKALGNTIRQIAPSISIDDRVLFREFLKEVRRRCSTWEKVPDRYVNIDQV